MMAGDPIEADLSGPYSGKRMHVTPDLDYPGARLLLPPALRVTLGTGQGEEVTRPWLPVSTYRRTGVRDDGRRVFAYQAAAQRPAVTGERRATR